MPLSRAEFDYIRALVAKRSAIVLDCEKTYLAETRLLPLAWREGYASVDELMTQLRPGQNEPLHERVVEAMTTNETSFFRDVGTFDCLRDMALPELIENRAAERRLNIWSSACASGQEPYSIALLLEEHFPLLASWRTRILASDLNTDMLERTRAGCYSQLEINRGLPARYLVKYFDKQDSDWQVKQSLRDRVEVQRINLIEDWQGLPSMDIVMLRNVLIYFDTATKKTVLGRIRALLRPDGYLFLGGSETTLNLDDAFERVEAARAGCYRLRARQRVTMAPSNLGNRMLIAHQSPAEMQNEICAATESVFHLMLGWNVRRCRRATNAGPDGFCFEVRVSIRGDWGGAVLLRMPANLARQSAAAFFGMAANAVSNQQIQDAVGELTNIMAGNFKALLPGVTTLGVPQAVQPEESNDRQPGQPIMELTFTCQNSFVGLTIVGE